MALVAWLGLDHVQDACAGGCAGDKGPATTVHETSSSSFPSSVRWLISGSVRACVTAYKTRQSRPWRLAMAMAIGSIHPSIHPPTHPNRNQPNPATPPPLPLLQGCDASTQPCNRSAKYSTIPLVNHHDDDDTTISANGDPSPGILRLIRVLFRQDKCKRALRSLSIIRYA